MNRVFFSFAFIFFLGFTLSCTAQNSETRSFDSFSGIASSEGIKVTVKKGSKNEAHITTSGIDVDRVESKIEYGMLKFSIDGNKKGRMNVEVELTYSGNLTKLSASSAGSIIVEDDLKNNDDLTLKASSAGHIKIEGDVKADDLSIKVSSAGGIKINHATSSNANLEASSAGKMTISGGKTGDVNAEVSSSGHIYAGDFKADDVNASASSGGGVKIHVDGKLKANASSGGSIKYNGSPSNTNINKSSGGSVRSL